QGKEVKKLQEKVRKLFKKGDDDIRKKAYELVNYCDNLADNCLDKEKIKLVLAEIPEIANRYKKYEEEEEKNDSSDSEELIEETKEPEDLVMLDFLVEDIKLRFSYGLDGQQFEGIKGRFSTLRIPQTRFSNAQLEANQADRQRKEIIVHVKKSLLEPRGNTLFVKPEKKTEELSFILLKAMREKFQNEGSGVFLKVKGETELRYKEKKIDYLFLDRLLVKELGGAEKLLNQITKQGDEAVEPGIFSMLNWGKKFTFRHLDLSQEVKIIERPTSGYLKNCTNDIEENIEIPSGSTILQLDNKAFLLDDEPGIKEIDAIKELSEVYRNSRLNETQTVKFARLLKECREAATNGDEIAQTNDIQEIYKNYVLLDKCANSSAEELERTLKLITEKVLAQPKTAKLTGKSKGNAERDFQQKKRAAIEFFAEAWETAADFYRQEILGITPDPARKERELIDEAYNKFKSNGVNYEIFESARDAYRFLTKEEISDTDQWEITEKTRSNKLFVKLLKEAREIGKLEILEALILTEEKEIIKRILNEEKVREEQLELFKNALGQTKKDDRDKSPERESKDNDLTPLKFYHKDQPYYELSNFYYNKESKNIAGIAGEAKYPISCRIPKQLNEKGEAAKGERN
ncbi:22228_t:CDS:2, partial [Entrophospora sp. SA101]